MIKDTPQNLSAVPQGSGTRTRFDLWCLVFGGWLGLTVVKFGNPIILFELLPKPNDLSEFILLAWPITWAFLIFLGIAAFAIRHLELSLNSLQKAQWYLWLPASWLLWQGLATTTSVDHRLSLPTLGHFLICVMSFYLGRCLLSQQQRPLIWMGGFLFGYLWMLNSGLQQHFGGLEDSREAFFSLPDWKTYPVEYIKKVSSNRIFGTLFYPNALAGVVLSFGPLLAFGLFQLTYPKGNVVMGVTVGLFIYASLAALYWTESKTGFLLGMGLFGLWTLTLRFDKRMKVALVVLGVIVGSSVFAYKYADYFKKGATSVSARFDYWEAAWKTSMTHPLKGTGPGTFKHAYSTLKRPDSEMARLAHNDYLEQASDSGFPGMFLYLGIFPFFLWRNRPKKTSCSLAVAVWFGLFGWAAQGLAEFGLYIPAMAYPAFSLLGWLDGQNTSIGRANESTKV